MGKKRLDIQIKVDGGLVSLSSPQESAKKSLGRFKNSMTEIFDIDCQNGDRGAALTRTYASYSFLNLRKEGGRVRESPLAERVVLCMGPRLSFLSTIRRSVGRYSGIASIRRCFCCMVLLCRNSLAGIHAQSCHCPCVALGYRMCAGRVYLVSSHLAFLSVELKGTSRPNVGLDGWFQSRRTPFLSFSVHCARIRCKRRQR